MNKLKKHLLISLILLFISLNIAYAFETVTDTMAEGETKTYNLDGQDYEVTVTSITDTGTIYAKFNINSESTLSLAVGSKHMLSSGVVITVLDIIPNEAGDVTQDFVEFSLSSEEPELKLNQLALDGFILTEEAVNPASRGKHVFRVELTAFGFFKDVEIELSLTGEPPFMCIVNSTAPFNINSGFTVAKSLALNFPLNMSGETYTLKVMAYNKYDLFLHKNYYLFLQPQCSDGLDNDDDGLIDDGDNGCYNENGVYYPNFDDESIVWPRRAKVGVLVGFPNGTMHSECLDVIEDTNGYEIMEQTSLELLWSPDSPYGHMLCKINGFGNNLSGQYCEYSGSFWNPVLNLNRDGNWSNLPAGFDAPGDCWNRDENSWEGHYCAKQGDVLGFAYGPAESEPPYVSFEEICKPSKLGFDAMKVYVDGHRRSIEPHSLIKHVHPNSEIIFRGDIENLFYDEEDIDIEDIELKVIIKDIDHGKDLSFGRHINNLCADMFESFEARFDIPVDVEAGDYMVMIEAQGRDDNGFTHRIKWVLSLALEKHDHEIWITKASIWPSTISCARNVTLEIQIKNQGLYDEDEAALVVEHTGLGVQIEEYSIPELQAGTGPETEFGKNYSFSLSNNVPSGTYVLDVKAFYDTDNLADARLIWLTVENCDSDGDGFLEKDDLCPNTTEKEPYAPVIYGCSCRQILDLKPGENKGELKKDCSEATIKNFLQLRGWAKDLFQ